MNNVAPIDRWTAGHAAVGAFYGAVKAPWWMALSLGVGWEVAEIGLKARVPLLFPRPSQDTVINAVFDVAAVMLGWAIAQSFRRD